MHFIHLEFLKIWQMKNYTVKLPIRIYTTLEIWKSVQN